VINSEAKPDMAPGHSKQPVTNLFLIYSPLHYLAAESIAVHFEQNAHNYLFYLKLEFQKLVDPSKWDAVNFLPWPRFYPEKGLFGGMRRAVKNLKLVAGLCEGATTIRLHTTVIDTEAVNYLINFLKASFPCASFSVRIIPDGLLNIRRHPMGRLKEALQYLKKARRLFFPALDYYTFSGDRTGSDDPIVDRIYLLPHFPHQYNSAKTVKLPSLTASPESEETGWHAPRALVIGQPLVDFKRMSVANVEVVTRGIRDFIEQCSILEIDYKAHPKDRERDYDNPDYHDLNIDIALESYLSKHPYDLVIGVCSTALLTARLIMPISTRVVAYGINLMEFRSKNEREEIESPFKKLDVKIVDA